MGRKSDIYEVSVADLKDAVANSSTFTDVFRRLGLKWSSGGKYATLKRRLAEEGIDTSHIPKDYGRTGKYLAELNQPKPLETVMVENSTYGRGSLKKQIIRLGILPYVCQLCGQAPEWQGQPLTLVLDHINGKRDDHRKENLRFLCPNCNSQTETFAGRNKTRKP